MAIDKAVDSAQLNADLTSVANAIRTKGGTSASLAFPADFISAINAISGGGGTGLEYKSGTFTFASDYGGGAGTYNVPHGLGEIPGLVMVWTEYYDDGLHTPSQNTNYGVVQVYGISPLEQRLSSTVSTDRFLSVPLMIYSGTNTIAVQVPSSSSYMPGVPDATNIVLNKRQVNSNNYWTGGITYKWLVAKKWW